MTDLFRGKSLKVAGLVTSLVFALPHATNIVEFVMYTCMGILLFVTYQRRGNLRDSILLHIFNNLFPAITLLLMGLEFIRKTLRYHYRGVFKNEGRLLIWLSALEQVFFDDVIGMISNISSQTGDS